MVDADADVDVGGFQALGCGAAFDVFVVVEGGLGHELHEAQGAGPGGNVFDEAGFFAHDGGGEGAVDGGAVPLRGFGGVCGLDFGGEGVGPGELPTHEDAVVGLSPGAAGDLAADDVVAERVAFGGVAEVGQAPFVGFVVGFCVGLGGAEADGFEVAGGVVLAEAREFVGAGCFPVGVVEPGDLVGACAGFERSGLDVVLAQAQAGDVAVEAERVLGPGFLPEIVGLLFVVEAKIGEREEVGEASLAEILVVARGEFEFADGVDEFLVFLGAEQGFVDFPGHFVGHVAVGIFAQGAGEEFAFFLGVAAFAFDACQVKEGVIGVAEFGVLGEDGLEHFLALIELVFVVMVAAECVHAADAVAFVCWFGAGVDDLLVVFVGVFDAAQAHECAGTQEMKSAAVGSGEFRGIEGFDLLVRVAKSDAGEEAFGAAQACKVGRFFGKFLDGFGEEVVDTVGEGVVGECIEAFGVFGGRFGG